MYMSMYEHPTHAYHLFSPSLHYTLGLSLDALPGCMSALGYIVYYEGLPATLREGHDSLARMKLTCLSDALLSVIQALVTPGSYSIE
jgi:hypothetical protein